MTRRAYSTRKRNELNARWANRNTPTPVWGGESVVFNWHGVLMRWLRVAMKTKRVLWEEIEWFNCRYVAKHRPSCMSEQLGPAMRRAVEISASAPGWSFRPEMVPQPLSACEKKRNFPSRVFQTLFKQGLRASDIPAPLLEAKRAHLKVKREIKERMR